MRRILFVDDETRILKDFIKAFINTDFEVITADTGVEALEVLDKQNIDLVISDMRMPVMDGYDLLTEIKKRHPKVLRIILSGYSDEKVVFKALQKNVAKLYMFKPWENKKLHDTIVNVLETQDILQNHDLLTLVNNVKQLPTIPANYVKILRLIEDDANASDISEAIMRDQSIASKILHVANSAYYGGKTGSIKQAVAQIGLIGTRELVLSASVIDAFNNDKGLQIHMEKIWDHAFITNKMLAMFYEQVLDKKIPVNFQSVGLLHNIGVVFLLNFFGKEYLRLLLQAKNNKIDILEAEKEAYMTNHLEAGAYLMDWWGFPYSIVEAALHHDDPSSDKIVNKELVCALHIVQYLAAIKIKSAFYEQLNEEALAYFEIDEETLLEKIII